MTVLEQAQRKLDEKQKRVKATEPLPDEAPPPSWVGKVQQWRAPADLLTREIKVLFAVDQLIQAGQIGALVAAGGTGKTTLKIHLAVCHALARNFLGMAVRPGSFVLLSADDTQDDLDMALALVVRAMKLTADEAAIVAKRVRVVSLKGDPGIREFTKTIHGDVCATGLEELVIRAVQGIPELVGIGLDTLRQFAGGSSNDEQVVKLTVYAAAEIARRTGAYVVLSHHTGKQNYRDGVADQYAGSGSAAIGDNCRFVLLLQTTTWSDIESSVQRTGQEAGEPLVLRSTRGSLLVKPADPVFMCRDGFNITRIAGRNRTEDQKADERDRAILRAIRNGAQTRDTIVAAVKGKRATVLERIADLSARGMMASSSPTGSQRAQQFVLTAAGGRFLDAEA